MQYIKLEDCKHGFVYFIHSRNLKLGVFNKKSNGFIGIRTKFNDRYLFTEYHWDFCSTYGTVKPIKLIMQVPEDIVIADSLGTFCSICNANVNFTKDIGWSHDDGSNICHNSTAYNKPNIKLFEFLDTINVSQLKDI